MSRSDRNILGGAIHASVLALCLSSMTVQAAPSASGNAWDLSAQVKVATVSVLSLGLQNQVKFDDQTSPYSDSASAVSFDSGNIGLARLQTGAIGVETQWIPGPSMLAVGAQASIADIDLGVVSALDDSLLSLQADVIRSTAIVTGTCPSSTAPRAARPASLVDGYIYRDGFDPDNLLPGGDAETPGTTVDVTTLSEPLLDLPSIPAPNTTVDAGVLTLVLNEEIIGGDGITSRSVTRNGLHLSVNVAGVITADVILSHAEASIDCGID